VSRLRLLIVGLIAASALVSAVVAGYGWLLIDRQQALDNSRVSDVSVHRPVGAGGGRT